MGDVRLSEMKATYYPPSIQPAFMGARPPIKSGMGSLYDSGNINYFQSYRNENISKMQMPPYDFGVIKTPYTPKPDIAMLGLNDSNRHAKLPRSEITMQDKARQGEVDNFYMLCQKHRDQYMDHSGILHPLDYFKRTEYKYQCPTDPTSVYTKFPRYYVRYKSPPTLPLTLERTNRIPPLPARALTGTFSPCSDITYKR